MDIKKYDYHIVESGVIKCFETFIAEDEEDPDWQFYQNWVTSGGVPFASGVWEEEQWKVVRRTRDYMLKESDWRVLPDSALSSGDKSAWEIYRQELRDIPQEQSDPFNITWPTISG